MFSKIAVLAVSTNAASLRGRSLEFVKVSPVPQNTWSPSWGCKRDKGGWGWWTKCEKTADVACAMWATDSEWGAIRNGATLQQTCAHSKWGRTKCASTCAAAAANFPGDNWEAGRWKTFGHASPEVSCALWAQEDEDLWGALTKSGSLKKACRSPMGLNKCRGTCQRLLGLLEDKKAQNDFTGFEGRWQVAGSGSTVQTTASSSWSKTTSTTTANGFTTSLGVTASMEFADIGTLGYSATNTLSTSVSETLSQMQGGRNSITCGSEHCDGNLWQWGVVGTRADGTTERVSQCAFVCIGIDKPITVKPKCPRGFCGDSDCQCCNSNEFAPAGDARDSVRMCAVAD